MYMHCRHIKTNGLRCESPALKGSQFCYYHSKVHTIGVKPKRKFGPLQLPAPEDSAAIQLSVARINDALINGRIDLKKATGLFYGIQIAAQFIDRRMYFDKDKTVRFAERSPEGDELAPGNYICNNGDCNICPFATVDQCTRWEYTDKTNQDADTGSESNDGDEGQDGEDNDDGDLGEGNADGEEGEDDEQAPM